MERRKRDDPVEVAKAKLNVVRAQIVKALRQGDVETACALLNEDERAFEEFARAFAESQAANTETLEEQ